ncbi:hypothetical protein RHMOL_Rhmol01G0382500 [Rhododendron molle]|uniref:Uncharacterized protein n=1 Tax=Rhododendron molle TaxID=49168 RepID=A0ACC0QAN8_RHOML|nr:hypothetical protein RHMOL_Rhmol01G0382500 [Rhododendron molle]
MMHKKKSGVANRAWNLLRLALLWARKGGPFKHGLMLDLRLFPKFLKTGLIGQSSTQRAAIYYGERELSFDDTPIIPVKMHRPSSLRFRLPRIPCIIPPVDFDYNFNFDDNKDFLSRYKFEYDEGRKSFSNGGDDDDDENCEVCEDEGIDAKAEQFIAKFYEQMRMQRQQYHLISDEIDGTCAKANPYSTPGRDPTSGYFFSAPSSPMQYLVLSCTFPPPPSSQPTTTAFYSTNSSTMSGSIDFDSSNFSPNASIPNESMMSADELFLNGQIRPMKLSSHLQTLAPVLDLEVEDEQDKQKGNIIKDSYCENRQDLVTRERDLSSRSISLHRKTRSMSRLRTEQFFWQDDNAFESKQADENKKGGTPPIDTTLSCSSSSSSSGCNSKKWIFLKDLLHRSKSEGGGNNKDKFLPNITFSPVKEKKLASSSISPFSFSSRDDKDKNRMHTEKHKGNKQVRMKNGVAAKPANGAMAKRASAHELHYTANRAQAEEMKKKTYLPYRQGLLGCLGFSSKGYGAVNGFTKTLNPVSSR